MRKFLWFFLLLPLVGCGPPPAPGGPPLLGPGLGPWIGWILVLFLAVLMVLLFTGVLTARGKDSFRGSSGRDLEDLKERLDSLERAVARMEKILRELREGKEE